MGREPSPSCASADVESSTVELRSNRRSLFRYTSVCFPVTLRLPEALQHGEIVTGLRLEPEGHAGVVLCHDLVEESLGPHGDALAASVAVDVPAAFVGLLGVSAQTQLPHDAVEGLPDVVLHGSRGFDELAVEHGSTGASLCQGQQNSQQVHTVGKMQQTQAADLSPHR